MVVVNAKCEFFAWGPETAPLGGFEVSPISLSWELLQAAEKNLHMA